MCMCAHAFKHICVHVCARAHHIPYTLLYGTGVYAHACRVTDLTFILFFIIINIFFCKIVFIYVFKLSILHCVRACANTCASCIVSHDLDKVNSAR